MIYPFSRRKLFFPLFLAYLFGLLYLTRDSQAGLYLLGFYRAQFLSMGLTAAVAAAFLAENRRRLKAIFTDGRVVLTVLFSLSILIPMAVKRDYQMMYFSVLYCVLASMLISYFVSLRDTARAYVLLLSFLSLYSLVCSYMLRLSADRGMLVPPTFANSFDAVFYNYIFSFVSVTFAKSRNFGIFREPGVYQFFLLLALYLNNYQAQWQRERTMWLFNALLMVTMLSTFATGGVAVMLVFALVLYFDKGVWHAKFGKICTILGLALAVLLGIYLVAAQPPLYTQIRLMVEKVFTSNPSLDDRIESIAFNLSVLEWTPLQGRTVDYILNTVTHNTSSSTILIGILGSFFGLLNLFGWITLVLRGQGGIPAKLVSILAIVAACNTENLITNPYLWLFPILALTEALLPLWSPKRTA